MSEIHLDKRQVVCPLSLALGHVQNYRVSERPNKGCHGSRPASSDAFYEDFFRVLHASKDEEVQVECTGIIPESGYTSIVTEGAEPGDIGTYTKTLRGLGQGPGTELGGEKGAKELKFSQKAGLEARQRAIQMVNSGEIRAPKKNWDKTFGPEQTVTFTDADGETMTFQIGGGTNLDELKSMYPELYNQRRKKSEETPEKEIAAKTDDDFEDDYEDDEDDDYERAPKMETAIADEELEAIADEVGDGEAAFSEEEETYAVAATADIEHEHTMTVVIDRPDKVTTVTTNAMVVVGPDGNDQTYYMVVHPATGEHVWVKEGDNSCPHCGFAVEVR